MAKKDKSQVDDETKADTEGSEPEVSEEPKNSDLTGLVKMTKDGKEIHAHPHVVDHHKKHGWKLA